MGWEVTAGEVAEGIGELEEQLSGALRWARGGLESVEAHSREVVAENIEGLAELADRLEGIASRAAEIRWLSEEAEQRFEELDEENLSVDSASEEGYEPEVF